MTVTEPDAGVAGAAPVALVHSVYGSFDGCAGMAGAWDAFVEEAGGDIFSTFGWQSTWWKHYGAPLGRSLEIHVITDGGRIIGIYPLFREKVRLGPLSVRAIKVVGCDHTLGTSNVVVAPGREADCARAVIASLSPTGRPSWDILQIGPVAAFFDGVDSGARALSDAAGSFAETGVITVGPHMLFFLPDTPEKYLASLSTNQRRDLKQGGRRMAEAFQVSVVMHERPEDVAGIFDKFVTQHQEQWRARGRQGHFGDWRGTKEFYAEAARGQAALGRSHVLELCAGDTAVAILFAFRFAGKAYWLLSSRILERKWDYYAPGKLAVWYGISESIRRGARLMDAMHGEYDYEKRMGATLGERRMINVVRRGLSTKWRLKVFSAIAYMLDYLYYRAWFKRVAPALKWRRGPLWECWIRSRSLSVLKACSRKDGDKILADGRDKAESQ